MTGWNILQPYEEFIVWFTDPLGKRHWLHGQDGELERIATREELSQVMKFLEIAK